MLDLGIFKGDRFDRCRQFDVGMHFKPTNQGCPLDSRSCHPSSIHAVWPLAWDSLIGTVGLGGLWLGRMHATWQAITPATSKPAMAFGLVAHAHTPAYSLPTGVPYSLSPDRPPNPTASFRDLSVPQPCGTAHSARVWNESTWAVTPGRLAPKVRWGRSQRSPVEHGARVHTSRFGRLAWVQSFQWGWEGCLLEVGRSKQLRPK
jgi:hypothetical protein